MTAQVNNHIYDELAQTWWDENEFFHLLSEESCTANAECPDMESRPGAMQRKRKAKSK